MTNTNFLKTVASCDAVINELTNLKTGLLLEKSRLEYNLSNEATEASELPNEMAEATAKWQAAKDVFDGLSPGSEKNNQEIELNRLRNKMLEVEERSKKVGDEASYDRSVQLEFKTNKITSIDSILTEVTARKAALEAQAA